MSDGERMNPPSAYPIGRADPDDNKNQRFHAARQGVIGLIAGGFPVVSNFLDALTARVKFAKTDTTLRTGLTVMSNEAAASAGLSVALTGGAAQANRIVDLQTGELTVANAGVLGLQRFGGQTAIGGTAGTANVLAVSSGTTNGEVTIWDKSGHMTITQAAVPTQTLNTGAGTGPTNTGCFAGSNDQYGRVQWTQGTGVVAANTTIMTVAFRNAYTVAPVSISLTSASANTNNGLLIAANITVNGFDILNGATQATVATGTAAVCYRVN